MNFDTSEDERLLADSLRRFLARDYGFEQRRKIVASAEGYSAAVWARFAEMGLTALPLPAEYGGFGGGAIEVMGVMEALGEALVVEPYLATVLAARLLACAGSEAQKKALLPGIAEGRVKLAFAHTERGARYNLARVAAQARKTADGWEISGEKCVALGACAADRLVVSAMSEVGTSLYLVDAKAAGLVLEASLTLDGMRAADVTLANVAVGAEALLGAEGGALPLIEEAVDFATALVCAEGVGAMQYACDATLEYLKTRKQFGVPIGAFQVLQHRMVDMVIACEQARSMACLACSQVDAPANTAAAVRARARAVSAAKIKIADSCRHISQEAIQLHGGMGMSEDLKVSHTFRRLTMIAQQFGDADHHLERFVACSTEMDG